MKRIIAVLFAVGVLLLGAYACAGADLTLLVYMCGADLQSSACYDIYEMALAETGDNINIVILAGGAPEGAVTVRIIPEGDATRKIEIIYPDR